MPAFSPNDLRIIPICYSQNSRHCFFTHSSHSRLMIPNARLTTRAYSTLPGKALNLGASPESPIRHSISFTSRKRLKEFSKPQPAAAVCAEIPPIAGGIGTPPLPPPGASFPRLSGLLKQSTHAPNRAEGHPFRDKAHGAQQRPIEHFPDLPMTYIKEATPASISKIYIVSQPGIWET